MGAVVDPSGHVGTVGIAVLKADQNLFAHARNGNRAEAIAGMGLADLYPATGVFIPAAVAVPVKAEFDAAVAVATEFIAGSPHHQRGLGAVDAGLAGAGRGAVGGAGRLQGDVAITAVAGVGVILDGQGAAEDQIGFVVAGGHRIAGQGDRVSGSHAAQAAAALCQLAATGGLFHADAGDEAGFRLAMRGERGGIGGQARVCVRICARGISRQRRIGAAIGPGDLFQCMRRRVVWQTDCVQRFGGGLLKVVVAGAPAAGGERFGKGEPGQVFFIDFTADVETHAGLCGIRRGRMGARGIRQYHGVVPLAVFKIIVQAEFLHEAADEVKIGFAVLHHKGLVGVTLHGAGVQTVGIAGNLRSPGIGLMAVEHRLHDFRHGHALEYPVVAGQPGQCQPGFQRDFHPGAPGVQADETGRGDQAADVALDEAGRIAVQLNPHGGGLADQGANVDIGGLRRADVGIRCAQAKGVEEWLRQRFGAVQGGDFQCGDAAHAGL